MLKNNYYISTQKIKLLLTGFIIMLLAPMACDQAVLFAQQLYHFDQKEHSSPFEGFAVTKMSDLRAAFVDHDTLDDHMKRGVVCVYDGFEFRYGCEREESTNRWKTLTDVLRDMAMLERTNAFPQIRVVQRNAIVQSSVSYPRTGPVSGYSADLLDHRLYAGDFIIVADVSY